jgi:hypothetical protein
MTREELRRVIREWFQETGKAGLPAVYSDAERYLRVLEDRILALVAPPKPESGTLATAHSNAKELETFTCLQCGITSYNQNDVRLSYCGSCHRFAQIIAADNDVASAITAGAAAIVGISPVDVVVFFFRRGPLHLPTVAWTGRSTRAPQNGQWLI